MDYVGDKARLEEFCTKHPEIMVSYGGDGTILSIWRDAVRMRKTIYPVRNYGRCEKHVDPFASVNLDAVRQNRIVVCEHVVRSSGLSYKYDALSEIQVKSSDVTSALRMDIYVDGTKFCENVIADAKEKADDIIRRAEEDAALSRRRAEKDIKKEIADVSVALTGKLLEKEISEDDQRRLIDSFIGEIGENNDTNS